MVKFLNGALVSAHICPIKSSSREIFNSAVLLLFRCASLMSVYYMTFKLWINLEGFLMLSFKLRIILIFKYLLLLVLNLCE